MPSVVERCATRWSLSLAKPYGESSASLVMPATAPQGDEVVLKIQSPHREGDHEATALRLWNSSGAVRLLDYDAADHALLLERCTPGTHLSELDSKDALGVLIELLPRLWLPANAPLTPLTSEVAWWVEALPRQWYEAGCPFERELVDVAIEMLEELSASQGEQVLIHQDLHADNVLRSEREPWLVIDPKPLTAEREFAIAPIVRSYELGHSEDFVLGRLDRLSQELDLDRERARGWAIGQTLAWAFEEDQVLPRHVETAGWLLGA